MARPALNGSRGVCVSYNDETGRYNVQLPKGEMIALRPSNLTGATDAGATARPSEGPRVPDAVEKERRKKASIGARLAQQRNEKGVSWAKSGVNSTTGGITGAFASEERKQAVAQKKASRMKKRPPG